MAWVSGDGASFDVQVLYIIIIARKADWGRLCAKIYHFEVKYNHLVLDISTDQRPQFSDRHDTTTFPGTKRPFGAAGLVDNRRKEILYIRQDSSCYAHKNCQWHSN